MKRPLMSAVVALILIALIGCAPGPNRLVDSPDGEGKIAGFWKGLWHGIISPVTFIISLFSDKVHLYEVHNSGNWYNLGFLIGVIIIFSGSGRSIRRRSKRC